MNVTYENDFYIIDESFRLLSFNDSVKKRYPEVKIGELCYKTTMNRESPCLHCPIAGNSKTTSPIFYDPYYGAFVESIFSHLGDSKYCVVCRPARNHDTLQTIDAICSLFFDVHKFDLRESQFVEIKTLPKIHELIGTAGDAQTCIDKLFESNISGLNDEDFRNLGNVSEWKTLFKDKDYYTVDYKGLVAGWSRAHLVVSERDNDGNAIQVIFAISDINEEKRLEQRIKDAAFNAEQANQAKTSFLFNMSHDIRTPMNAILGYTELAIKNNPESDKQLYYLDKIKSSGLLLLSILNNVLEMARIEKGTLVLDEQAWSDEQFNDTLFDVFDEQMKQKGITFTRDIRVKNEYVYCDPAKLRQIFLNILSNAYKYTERGGSVRMVLEEIPYDRPGYALYKTTISDTGIGMSQDFLERIFDEFSREKASEKNDIEGTGLGMAIVKRLVDLMEGTIEVKSTKGKGTVITVIIPHRIAKRNDAFDHSESSLVQKNFAGKRVLLAEDNDLNAEIAMELLDDAGLRVERAEDGQKCVDLIREKPAYYYDVILMDIQMPVMNGYDATRSIRNMDDMEKSDIPIIALTANAFEEDKNAAIKAGMNGHLRKPVNIDKLLSTLNEVFLGHTNVSEIAEAYDNEIREKIYVDPLTSAYNRRFYDEQKNKAKISAFAIFDIDLFKTVNDRFGHQTGDNVLTTVAATVTKQIRATDALIRYGGDEFVILFNHINSKILKQRLEQIRESIEALSFREHPELKVSLSIGAVMTDNLGDEALAAADKKLYEAKKIRNTVIM